MVAQREEIALGRARGDSIRTIAAFLDRSPSTVSRELRAQRRRPWPPRSHHRASNGLPPRLPSKAQQAAHQLEAAWHGGGGPGQEVLPGADRGPAAPDRDGRNDILAEAAGITAGSWYASPATHLGYELIGAGMLILAGDGRGLPLDYGELQRWSRVGYEWETAMRRGER